MNKILKDKNLRDEKFLLMRNDSPPLMDILIRSVYEIPIELITYMYDDIWGIQKIDVPVNHSLKEATPDV